MRDHKFWFIQLRWGMNFRFFNEFQTYVRFGEVNSLLKELISKCTSGVKPIDDENTECNVIFIYFGTLIID